MEISIDIVFKIIVPATIISGIISALVTNYINWKINLLNFKHDYYKEIIRKRIVAYELIEDIINQLREVVVDSDGKKYHRIFSYDEEYYNKFLSKIFFSGQTTLWTNKNIEEQFLRLNSFFLKSTKSMIFRKN